MLSSACAQGGGAFNSGPLFDRFPLTLASGERTEVAGPFFYSESRDGEGTWAVPPLFSFYRESVIDAVEVDLLYPLITFDRYGAEYRWQLLQLLSFSGGQNQQELSSHRFTLFPVYFQQRSKDPDLNYTAIVPFYGRLKNRLLRDEIFFVMFPIYSETKKRDVTTDNYLYPIFHLREGPGLRGWQFWPVAGYEQKGITSRTNGFGEVTTAGGHEKLFVLWPVYFNQTVGIGTENPVNDQAVLPLFSKTRSPRRDSTTVVWPFFSRIEDREKSYTEWQAPWPFVVFARGEGKRANRVWPLYSNVQSTNLESAFILWPVYKYNRVHAGALDRERTRILFFLYSDITQKNTESGEALQRKDFWPLFTYRRDYNGSTRLQMLAPIEPILPNNKSIERNYSPLWSVWRSEQNARTGAASQSLLWNLYRRDETTGSRKCSLLFGLFQYQSGSEGRRLRLFYVPLLKTEGAKDADTPNG